MEAYWANLRAMCTYSQHICSYSAEANKVEKQEKFCYDLAIVNLFPIILILLQNRNTSKYKVKTNNAM